MATNDNVGSVITVKDDIVFCSTERNLIKMTICRPDETSATYVLSIRDSRMIRELLHMSEAEARIIGVVEHTPSNT